MVLINQDELPENPAAQGVLIEKARNGASVMIFAQEQAGKLGTWDLRSRKAKAFTWRTEHPLFDGFAGDALDTWAREKGEELKVMSLPADAAVLELGCVSRETPGKNPVPIDALVATETAGAGRLVYCQLRVDSFKTDPRGQLLLANVLDYLLLRPEPTLPQSQRQPEPVKPTAPAGKQLIGANDER
jgi:hypothetical protein